MPNNTQEFYELDCERNQKFYVEVFFGLGDFFILLFYCKKFQFYFAVMPSNRRQASSENRISVENQRRVRAGKK